MNHNPKLLLAVLLLTACAGTGPSQAEGPKPDLDKPSKAETGGASEASMAALEAAEKKDYEGAKSKSEAVLAKDPNDAVAHYARGIVAEQHEKNLDEAEKHYRAALKADPKLVGASIFLSALLIDKKNFEEAAKVCRAGIEHSKAVVELHLNLASALSGAGDHEKAAKSYGNALALKDDLQVRVWYAEELAASGNKDAAAKEYKNLLSKGGKDLSVVKVAGLGLRKVGDYTGCVSAFDQAIALKNEGPSYTERALCKQKGGDLPGARKDAEEAVKMDSTSKSNFIAGQITEEAKDKKACFKYYTEAAKLAAAAKPGTKVEEEAKKGADRCK